MAFLPGGATSDAALARAELGVNNAKRTAKEAEKKRAARKRKAEDALFKSVQDSPAILARIDSLTDLKKLKRPELITLHLSIFRRNLRGQPKKSELIAALSPEILKELEKSIQQPEPHAELPGVPAPAPVNENDAELPEMAKNQPAPATQTALEPPTTGANDSL